MLPVVIGARAVSGACFATWLLHRIRRQVVPYTLRRNGILIPILYERGSGHDTFQAFMQTALLKGHTPLPSSDPQWQRIATVARRILPHAIDPIGTLTWFLSEGVSSKILLDTVSYTQDIELV